MEFAGLAGIVTKIIIWAKVNNVAIGAAVMHETAMRKLTKVKRTWKDSISSMFLAVTIGYGWKMFATAYFEWQGIPVQETAVNAVWFTGTFGGFPAILWVASHIEDFIGRKK